VTRSGEPLRIEPGADDHALVLSGEIDASTAGQLADVPVPADGDLVLDFVGVTFIDSSGLAALIGLAGRLADGGLVISRPSSAVRMVLDLVDAAEIPGLVVQDAT
jgi:anti-anti-sigma factor